MQGFEIRTLYTIAQFEALVKYGDLACNDGRSLCDSAITSQLQVADARNVNGKLFFFFLYRWRESKCGY